MARRLAATVLIVALTLLFGWQPTANAQGAKKKIEAANGPIQDFTSAHFLIHTDLSAKEAAEQLKKLETMLKLVSTYWKRPPSGTLECYIAKDIKAWPREVLAKMEPSGVAKIKEAAGVCITNSMSTGTQFVAKAVVYAVASGGVPQHEAVHGYCGQTFGRTGPQWYAEGMAELGNYWVGGKKGVNAHRYAIEYLQKHPPASVGELISLKETTGGTWQDYAKWWSLCHFLENNPNYNSTFRELGPSLLVGKSNQGFAQAFSGVGEQLSFEYFFFLKHIEAGYRCDLTAWDWRRKFRSLNTTAATISVPILADRGWQPSGLTVSSGKEYEYTTTGAWATEKGKSPVSANGDEDGKGKLVGVLMHDYKLTREFELGAKGTFKFNADGDLYLRCRDDWPLIGDHSGRVIVKLSVKAGEGEAAAAQE